MRFPSKIHLPSNLYAYSESSEQIRWKFPRRLYAVDSLISMYFKAGQRDPRRRHQKCHGEGKTPIPEPLGT